MSRTRSSILIVALVAVAIPAAAATPDLEPVRFMTGAWGVDGVIVEYWMPPLRGLMVGGNREPAGDGMPFFEYLRIEVREDGVYYVASPRGEGATDFKLTEFSEGKAVFENPEHDFPQKIIYVRTAEGLEAEVGAVRDGEWSSFKLVWTAQPCPGAD